MNRNDATAPSLNERAPSPGKNRAFTLIELLVVIAIIAILAAILFPVFAQAREKARAISCLSNSKQLGLAVMMYVQDYDETYPWSMNGPDGTNGIDAVDAWPDLVFPYVKNDGAYGCPSASAADPLSGDSDALAKGKLRCWCANASVLGMAGGDTLGDYNGYNAEIRSLAAIPEPAGTIMLNEGYPDGVIHRLGPDGKVTGNVSGNTWFYWGWSVANEGFACVNDTTNSDFLSLYRHTQGGNYAFADGHSKWQRPDQTVRWKDPNDPTKGDMWQWYKRPGSLEPGNTTAGTTYSDICPAP